jgi:hypothetical protein
MLFASKAAILSFFAYILPCCPSKCLSLLAALMIVNLELSQVRFRSESTYLGNCLDATIAKNFCSLLPPDTESRFLLLPSPQDLPAMLSCPWNLEPCWAPFPLRTLLVSCVSIFLLLWVAAAAAVGFFIFTLDCLRKKTWPLGLASLENPLPLLLPCALRLGLWCHLGSRFLLRRAWGRKGWSTACRAAWVISLSSLCKSHISIFANIVQHCGKVRPSQLGNCYLPPKLAGGKIKNINHEHKYK